MSTLSLERGSRVAPAAHPGCPLEVDVRHRGDVAPHDWVLQARAIVRATAPDAAVEAHARGLRLLAPDLATLARAGAALDAALGDAVVLERPRVRYAEGPPRAEPVMTWRLRVPVGYHVPLAAELERRGARIDAVEILPPIANWNGSARLAPLIGFDGWLAERVPRATLSMRLSHWAPLPDGPHAA